MAHTPVLSPQSTPAPVRILNPEPGGSKFTSFKRASKYVRDGRADWYKGAIKFKATGDERLLSRNVVNELRRIPVCNPMALLTRHTRRRRAAAS